MSESSLVVGWHVYVTGEWLQLTLYEPVLCSLVFFSSINRLLMVEWLC